MTSEPSTSTHPSSSIRLARRNRFSLVMAVLFALLAIPAFSAGHWFSGVVMVLGVGVLLNEWWTPQRRTLIIKRAYQPGGEPLFCYRVTDGEDSRLYLATDECHLFWLTEYDSVKRTATIECLGEVRY